MARRAPAGNFPALLFPELFPMTAPAIPAPAPKGRLGNGQLRRQVAEWLAARPRPHTVGEIAKNPRRPARSVGHAPTTPARPAQAAPPARQPHPPHAHSAAPAP